ncbi:MAG: hypothetical protein HYV96_10100 [Opitutae bacterium]|nr:hypothetical protein [Opitutae bacterium]
MNHLKKLIVGLVTSLLVSVGFVRAAEFTAGSSAVVTAEHAQVTAPGSQLPCAWI